MHYVDALAAAYGSAALITLSKNIRLRHLIRIGKTVAVAGALALGVLAVLHLLVAVSNRQGDPLSLTLQGVSLTLPVLAFALLVFHQRTVHPPKAPAADVILAVGAHPDDLELACGGTLARYADAGIEVHGLVMSHGAQGGDGDVRIAEAEAGARLMGLTSIRVLNHPDTRLGQAGTAMVRDVEQALAEIRPTMILTHSQNDAHQDHLAVHLAVMRAARQHPSILCFESPSVTRAFAPTTFVDIADQLELKEAAVESHRDQSGKPYMTARRIRGLAAFRGSQARLGFAEGFEQVRLQLTVCPPDARTGSRIGGTPIMEQLVPLEPILIDTDTLPDSIPKIGDRSRVPAGVAPQEAAS